MWGRAFKLSYSTDIMIRASFVAAIFLILFATEAVVGKKIIS